jgi:hypothetical protein
MQRFGLSSVDVSTKLGQRGLTGTLDLLTKTVLSKMGPSGTALLSTFNTSKQAAANANEMIKAMPKSIQGLARSYDSGKISLGGWRKELKGLPPEQANLLQQYATLQNKSKGFNDALKRGGPAAMTYTEAIKKMSGGAIGFNTTLQLTGESSEDFKRAREQGRRVVQPRVAKTLRAGRRRQKLFNVPLAQAKQKVGSARHRPSVPSSSRSCPRSVDWFTQTQGRGGRARRGHRGRPRTCPSSPTPRSSLLVGRQGGRLVRQDGRPVRSRPALNVVRGFRSAATAADRRHSGMAGTFGGKLRKGFDAAPSGARSPPPGVPSRASPSPSAGSRATAGKAAWTGLVSGLKSVGLAMKTASLNALAYARSLATSALAGLRAAAAWTAQKIALIASAIAEKAAAIAQWALNLAMSANPITLIVLAIIAFVGVLVLAYNKIGWFRAFVNGAFQSIATIVGWVVNFIRDHWRLLLVILGGPIGLAVLLVIKYWKQISTFVSAAVTWVVGFVKGHWQLLFALITGPIGLAVGLVVKYWGKISSGFSSAYHATVNVGRSLGSWVAGLPGRIYGWLSGLAGGLSSRASAAWSSFKAVTISKASEALAWIRSIPGKAKSALGSLGGLLVSAGRALLQGFINGIKSMASPVASAAHSVLSKISGLFPHSPAEWGPFSGSGWTLHSGRALMQGLVAGINDGSPRAVSTMAAAAQATSDAFARTLGIASPSKVFRQLGIYVNEGLVDGLTGSTARVKAATRRIESLLIQTYNKVADLKGHKGVSNKWVKSHEKTVKHLEAYAKKEDKILRSLAAKRDSVAAKLKSAQSKLAALQKQWSDEVKSVANGVMQGFSVVTEAPQEGFALSAQDVVNKMRDQMNKAVQFAAQLQALKKKGLSSDLLEQIAAAGVDQGGATAAALQNASASQIKQINSLNTTTKSAATSAGKAVADSMYRAGIKSAQGLVKGLQSQEKAIEKQMMRIAKSMEKAIKKALGIKSPSRVFTEIGTWIPKGLAKGVEASAHHATRAAEMLAGAVTGAGAGFMPGAGLAPVGARGGAAGATVVHNHCARSRMEGERADHGAEAVQGRHREGRCLQRGARNPMPRTPAYKR